MDSLIGRRFLIDQTEYAVVDVRNINGDTLVYAETGADVSQRVAVRSVAIEFLEEDETSVA